MSVTQLLSELLTACQGVYALLQSVYNIVRQTARENVPFHIATEVDIIGAVVTDASFGNQQINNNLLGLVTTVTADYDALTAQITALSDAVAAGVTVTTISAPAGDSVANSVWSSELGFVPTTASTALLGAYWDAHFRGIIEEPHFAAQADDPWVMAGDLTEDGQGDPSIGTAFTLDYTTIIASDATSADWLRRVYDTYDWSTFQNGCLGLPDPGGNTFWWVVWLPQEVWLGLKLSLGLNASAAAVAPVWPGLDGVTLGAPVSISLTFTVDGPLQGVIVALTAVPDLKGHYDYDGLEQSLKIGALTFVSDNGDAEYIQALGFAAEVYVPKNMSSAASCKVRTVSGVTGTVTPFTIP